MPILLIYIILVKRPHRQKLPHWADRAFRRVGLPYCGKLENIMNEKPKTDWDPRSQAVFDDQIKAYDEMRRRCPVAFSEYMQWSLFRYEDVARAANDHETFSNVVS